MKVKLLNKPMVGATSSPEHDEKLVWVIDNSYDFAALDGENGGQQNMNGDKYKRDDFYTLMTF